MITVIIQHATTKDVLGVGAIDVAIYEWIMRHRLLKLQEGGCWASVLQENPDFARIEKMLISCDGKTLIVFVCPIGPVCSNGTTQSCFHAKCGQERHAS